MRPWQLCGKQHRGRDKVLATGGVTSETRQGEIDRSVHTSLYHAARLSLCPAQVGFAEFNNTADNRANIGGTIIGAPIVGQ